MPQIQLLTVKHRTGKKYMKNLPRKNWAIRGPVYRILRFAGVETCCITTGSLFIDRVSIAASETKKFSFQS